MNWILIIFVLGTGANVAPALTSVAIDTEAACQAAGVKVVQDFTARGRPQVIFSCVKKN
jgi:hypothetical protein